MGGVTIVPSTQAKANEIVPYASFIDVTVNKDKIIKKISVGSGPLENIFFLLPEAIVIPHQVHRFQMLRFL